MKAPPSLFRLVRLLKERYFGEETRKPHAARSALAELAPRLPADVAAIADDAVEALIDYQDADYALLYLDRLGRYAGATALAPQTFAALAGLLATRMQFEDPIRIAQLVLAEAGGATAAPGPARPVRVERFCWAEIVAMLPPVAAASVIEVLAWPPLAAIAERTVPLRFSARTRPGLWWLKGLSALRRARPFSQRFRAERAGVERWLHMIDRTRLRHPEAVVEVVASASLIHGHGVSGRASLAKWNAIIDRLVKPANDGTLAITDLAGALRAATQAAMKTDPAGLSRVIEALRANAVASPPAPAVAMPVAPD